MPDPFESAQEEVRRYFEAKDTQVTWGWQDFATAEHAHSFTVARSAGYDVLDDIRGAVQKSISDFGSYGDFVDDLEPLLRRKGWWGRQRINGEVVELGSLRRLRTIYWANVSTARAAGEWERIQRTKRGLPFLIYELSVAEKRRPEHMGWVGVILPVDHSFWATHYPPNGWLCQCRVRQISRREALSLGYDETVDAPQVVTRRWTNKQTGEVLNIPEGIDPGWQSNPGATRAANVSGFLGDRMDRMSPQAQRVAVQDLVSSRQFRDLQAGDLPYAGPADRTPGNVELGRISLPVARLPEELQELMGARSRTVRFSNGDAHKQARKRINADGSGQLDAPDYALVQEIIETGEAYEDVRFERDFVFQLLRDGKPWSAVLRMTQDRREIFLKSFRRIRPEQYGETERHIPLR